MNNYKLVSSLKIIFLCLFAVILSCSTSISLPTWYLSPNNGLDSNKIVSVGSGKKSTDAVLNALVNLIKLQHSEIEGRNERFVEKNDKDELINKSYTNVSEHASSGMIGGISIKHISTRVIEEIMDQSATDVYSSALSITWISAEGDTFIYEKADEEIHDQVVTTSPEVYGNVDTDRLIEYLSGIGFKIDRSNADGYYYIRLVIHRRDWIEIFSPIQS